MAVKIYAVHDKSGYAGSGTSAAGYCISGSNADPGQDLIYFDPDKTWVDIS